MMSMVWKRIVTYAGSADLHWFIRPAEKGSCSAPMSAGFSGGMLTVMRAGTPESAGAWHVGRHSERTVCRNIAVMAVISRCALEEIITAATLTKEQFDRETGYRTAQSIMRNLHAQGLLTDREYRQAELILVQKVPPVWAGLNNVISDKYR